MSYTLLDQKDVHVDNKKDMHVDASDLCLQIDKRLSEVTGKYREKSLSPPVKMVFLALPRQCFLCGSYLAIYILCFHCSLTVTSWEGLASWLACM